MLAAVLLVEPTSAADSAPTSNLDLSGSRHSALGMGGALLSPGRASYLRTMTLVLNMNKLCCAPPSPGVNKNLCFRSIWTREKNASTREKGVEGAPSALLRARWQ